MSNAAASHRMEQTGAERHRRGGRRPSEWELVSQNADSFQTYFTKRGCFGGAESIVGVTARALEKSDCK